MESLLLAWYQKVPPYIWILGHRRIKISPPCHTSSPSEWNPHQVSFPNTSYPDRVEIEQRNIKAINNVIDYERQEDDNRGDNRYSPLHVSRALIESVQVSLSEHQKLASVENQRSTNDLGPLEEHEVLPPKTFISGERHSTTSAEDLSEQWGISVAQAKLTLKATTRRLIRSALMPLAERY